jgi:hypothetical protein
MENWGSRWGWRDVWGDFWRCRLPSAAGEFGQCCPDAFRAMEADFAFGGMNVAIEFLGVHLEENDADGVEAAFGSAREGFAKAPGDDDIVDGSAVEKDVLLLSVCPGGAGTAEES